MFETSNSRSEAGRLLRAATPIQAPRVALRRLSPLLPLTAALVALIAVAVLVLPQPAHASSHDITGFAVTAGSANNATLTWTAPSRSGITVTHYQIFWVPSSIRDFYQAFNPAEFNKVRGGGPKSNGMLWPFRGSAYVGGSATSYTVTGLHGGIDYDFGIEAQGSGFNLYDADGNVVATIGEAGLFQVVEDIGIAGIPHPFRSINLTADPSRDSPGGIDIEAAWWTPYGTEVGSSITKAEMQYKLQSEPDWITVGDAGFSQYASYYPYPTNGGPINYAHRHTLLGLDPGKTYDFRIRAGNSAGWSAWTQASVTTPTSWPTTVTANSSDRLVEGGGPATVTFTLDKAAHRELRAVEAYVVVGSDHVQITSSPRSYEVPPGASVLISPLGDDSSPWFAKGSRTATVTITPIDDNAANGCRSVVVQYLFETGMREQVDFTIRDDDGGDNSGCTGLMGDGVPSALTLERSDIFSDGLLIVNVLAKLNRLSFDPVRVVNVEVHSSSTATQGQWGDSNGEGTVAGDFRIADTRLKILRRDVNAKWTDRHGTTHDWPTQVIINNGTGDPVDGRAEDSENIVLQATSGSLTSNLLTLNIGQMRRLAARQGYAVTPQPTSVTLTLGEGAGAEEAKTVDESSGQVNLTATLDAPAPSEGVSFRVFPGIDDTATRNIDYTLPEIITIPAGEQSGAGVITVLDDALDEDDETVNIGVVASLFHADLVGSATLTITDDDTAGVTVNAASPLAVAEGGNASYTVVLDSQPTSDVTISASSGDGARVAVLPAFHTISPDRWEDPVTFNINTLPDDDFDDESLSISHRVTSEDPRYAGLAVSTVPVEVSDPRGPQPVLNLTCIARTDVVGFFWEEPVWSGGEVQSYDYHLTLPDGQRNGGNLKDITWRVRQGDYQPGGEARIGITVNYDLPGGGRATSVEKTLTCRVPGGSPPQQQQANRAPVVSVPIADATIVHESETKQVSLSGVFSDADNDALTVTGGSSDKTKATVSVASDYSSLTVTAKARGTATITVTASDGRGGTVSDTFSVTVKAAPVVASAISDISGLEPFSVQEISLSGVFSDADGDSLTITVASSDDDVVTAVLGLDNELTIYALEEGTATITVTAQDSDGNTVSDAFDVSVEAPPQQGTPNQAPTVSSAIADATIVNESGTRRVSLSGVFGDADNDSLTITAASSDKTKATVSVASGYGSLTVNAQSRGTATITVTADDGNGGTVSDTFTVTIKFAPVVASALADVSDLEVDATQEVSLSSVFSDADGDELTITAASSDDAKATVTVAADQSKLTLTGVAEGAATITVTARDTDGNTVSHSFDAPVARKYAGLIASMYQWRNDPRYVDDKAHTDRWDRTLLTFGETVADTTLTKMTADEAQGYADRGWTRWVEVAKALKEVERG